MSHPIFTILPFYHTAMDSNYPTLSSLTLTIAFVLDGISIYQCIYFEKNWFENNMIKKLKNVYKMFIKRLFHFPHHSLSSWWCWLVMGFTHRSTGAISP